jgi:hypothetical protein
MKHIITTIALFLTFSCSATIITVSNNVLVPAMYQDFGSAQTASSDGDTLLFTASNLDYTVQTINKSLVIIGTGNFDEGLSVKFTNNSGAWPWEMNVNSDDVYISGIYLKPQYYNADPRGININSNNCTFNNCRIDEISISNSFNVVKNCQLRKLDIIDTASGIIIANNIFLPGSTMSGIVNPVSEPVIISNNIFYNITFNAINNWFLTNNIFMDALTGVCESCVIDNNLTSCSSCSLGALTGAILTNNIGPIDSQFISAPVNASSFTLPLNWESVNFDLIPGSLGESAGTDGTDIGLFGGPFPQNPLSNYGNTLIELPIITQFNLNNPVIPQGGTLQIDVTSTIPSN